jgi:hypothetical protein
VIVEILGKRRKRKGQTRKRKEMNEEKIYREICLSRGGKSLKKVLVLKKNEKKERE